MTSRALVGMVGDAEPDVPPEPQPPTDYYIKPGGAGNQNGLSWSNAFARFDDAAAAAVSGSRIWVSSGNYVINYVTSYSNKALTWIAPPQPRGQLGGRIASAHLDGSPGARFFNISGTAIGGGFFNIAFSADSYSSEAIRMSGQRYFTVHRCYSRTDDNSCKRDAPILRVVGSDPVDHLTFEHNDVHATYNLWADDLVSGTDATNWHIDSHMSNLKQTVCGGTGNQYGFNWFELPQIQLGGGANFDGLFCFYRYVECSESPAMQVVSGGGQKRVSLYFLTTERSKPPAVVLNNTRCSLSFPGGKFNDVGSLSGTSTIEGFVCAPTTKAALGGDLVPGEN